MIGFPKLKPKIFLLFILLFIIIGASVFLLLTPFPNFQSKYKQSPKTWKITVSYNLPTQQLSLQEMAIIDQTIRPDNRDAKFSDYTLVMKSGSGQEIYKTPVQINEVLIADPFISLKNPTAVFSAPEDFKTTLYLPHFPYASQLVITKKGKLMLSIALPKIESYAPLSVGKADAATCQPLQVVFVQDGYNGDFNAYHKAIDRIKSIIKSTPPYSEKPSMFDYKVIDNTETFGCSPTTVISCIQNSKITDVAFGRYPNAGKVIVILNNKNPVFDGKTAFGAGVIGGKVAVASDVSEKIDTEVGQLDLTQMNVMHEFLGHALGQLWDRYIYQGNLELIPSMRDYMKHAKLRSNCTDNSKGEAFWKAAGVNQAYPGCIVDDFYAPGPRTCNDPNNGTHESIMSVGGCGKLQFDTIEQVWISKNILPLYGDCSTTPSVSVSPSPSSKITPSLSLTPTKGPTPTPCSRSGSATNSAVFFVKLGGAVATPSASPTLPPCPSPTITPRFSPTPIASTSPTVVPTEIAVVPTDLPVVPTVAGGEIPEVPTLAPPVVPPGGGGGGAPSGGGRGLPGFGGGAGAPGFGGGGFGGGFAGGFGGFPFFPFFPPFPFFFPFFFF